MKKDKTIDKNGVPRVLEVGVFYTIDKDGNIDYDLEAMRNDLENLIMDLPTN